MTPLADLVRAELWRVRFADALLAGASQRGSVFSPLDLSPALWLKADAITGLDDGDPVATWVDSSGNGNDATQATETKRPLWIQTGQNGLPLVRFDGTDDALGITLAARTAQTLVIVGAKRVAPTAIHQSLFGFGGNATMKCNSLLNATLWLWQYNQTLARVTLTGATAASWRVLTALATDATAMTVYQNGTSSSTFDPRDEVLSVTTLAVGAVSGDGTQACDVDVGEVLLYDSALSDADREQVEAYLTTRWGII